MDESPEKKELLSHLLTSHQMTLSMISQEIRNPLTLIYSTLQLIEAQHPEVTSFKYWSDIHHDIDYMILLLDELSL
jgi:nitrogen-specific signal transduction histidine kinase